MKTKFDPNVTYTLNDETGEVAAGVKEYCIMTLCNKLGVDVNNKVDYNKVNIRFNELINGRRKSYKGYTASKVMFSSDVKKHLRLILRPFHNVPLNNNNGWFKSVHKNACNALLVIFNYLNGKKMDNESLVVGKLFDLIRDLYDEDETATVSEGKPIETERFCKMFDMTGGKDYLECKYDARGRMQMEHYNSAEFEMVIKDNLDLPTANEIEQLRIKYCLYDNNRGKSDMAEDFSIKFNETYSKYYEAMTLDIIYAYLAISVCDNDVFTLFNNIDKYETYDYVEKVNYEKEAKMNEELINKLHTISRWCEFDNWCEDNDLNADDYYDMWLDIQMR